MSDRSTARTSTTLNLDRSRGPGVFRGEENLWGNDLHRIYRLIERQVAILDATDDARWPDVDRRHTGSVDSPHLSIAIFGPSGSGKSSLLRTLVDDIKRREDGHLLESLRGHVGSLDTLDPTTWAKSDQFLYAFLARALEKEQIMQEAFDRGQPQGLSSLQLAFQAVNEYLRVIDDPATPDEHDPLGLSLQRLERHTSGIRLKDALAKFIERLATALSAKVVLLPVDDLDMAPTHLVASLTTYQSFLMHPRLVPIFTFTDRMPEELIEAHFSQRLADGAKRTQSGGQRLTVSEQLALQFLARCFPVRNRIKLGPAPARVQLARFRATANNQEDGERADSCAVTDLLVASSFLLFGHPDKEDAHQIRAALRPSTLRRQFQVVDAMAYCGVDQLLTPQLVKMSRSRVEPDELYKIATGRSDDKVPEEHPWSTWDEDPQGPLLRTCLTKKDGSDLFQPGDAQSDNIYFKRLRQSLSKADTLARDGDATWASVFNVATWALLNVHRDTLREVGLYVEDLYSWSPKELRSVVLDRILAQGRITRRTVVDRWFNRSDYRRSQILSLLAANVFRPWMPGEEPFGDDQSALEQYQEDKKLSKTFRTCEPGDESTDVVALKRALTLPASQGLVWFLQVTLGFYLPQIMARNWSEACAIDEPLKGRMSGNGWDLQQAPINAMRIADARQEMFSFGMIFLDHDSMLEGFGNLASSAGARLAQRRHRLLLRLWTCLGFSRGRFWSAFSLWRGLGLIGRALELGERYRNRLCDSGLIKELKMLLRSHCLSGIVPGTLLDRGADEERLDKGFPAWEASDADNETCIEEMATSLVTWIKDCSELRILPYPGGPLWMGWKDCFLRRVHGEYILGALWPRLNSMYLEEQSEVQEADGTYAWTARTAARSWSDVVLDYWRGCPPILYLLLTCPVFLKSSERFKRWDKPMLKTTVGKFTGKSKEDKEITEKHRTKSDKRTRNWLRRLALPGTLWKLVLAEWEKQGGPTTEESLGVSPIERVKMKDFVVPPASRHAVELLPTKIEGTEDTKWPQTIRRIYDDDPAGGQ